MNIERAIREDKPPPCDSCVYFNHCKAKAEACGLFVAYWKSKDKELEQVPRSEQKRIPSEKWYNDTFTDFIGHVPKRQGL